SRPDYRDVGAKRVRESWIEDLGRGCRPTAIGSSVQDQNLILLRVWDICLVTAGAAVRKRQNQLRPASLLRQGATRRVLNISHWSSSGLTSCRCLLWSPRQH